MKINKIIPSVFFSLVLMNSVVPGVYANSEKPVDCRQWNFKLDTTSSMWLNGGKTFYFNKYACDINGHNGYLAGYLNGVSEVKRTLTFRIYNSNGVEVQTRTKVLNVGQNGGQMGGYFSFDLGSLHGGYYKIKVEKTGSTSSVDGNLRY